MKVGDVFEARWGRYAVLRLGPPVVLRSLERENAFVMGYPDVGPEYVATGESIPQGAALRLVGSDPVPSQTDPANGCELGGVGRPGRNESSPQRDQVRGTSHRGASPGGNLLVDPVDAFEGVPALSTHEDGPRVPGMLMGAGAPAGPNETKETTSLGIVDGGRSVTEQANWSAPETVVTAGETAAALPWRPGLNVVRMHGVRSWTPCLTRELDDQGRPLAREHAWFLDVTSSLYCWECRRSRARVVLGPEARIAEIRTALAAGDRALVDELVRRLSWTTAPPVNDREVPAVRPSAEPLGNPTEPGLILTRRRVDCLDVDAVDFVYERSFAGTDPDDWAEFFSERAAIFEYLGGHPRQVAEAKARQLAGPPPRSRHQRGEVTMARAG